MTATSRLLLVLALAATLAACGKKGPIEQPEGSTTAYPRIYPTR